MAQALGFMVAGFSGTTFIMAFTVFELTQHLDIQQKVREEILEQVNTHGGFSYDSLKNMKLLDLCIKGDLIYIIFKLMFVDKLGVEIFNLKTTRRNSLIVKSIFSQLFNSLMRV